jgi:hypothetical protein
MSPSALLHVALRRGWVLVPAIAGVTLVAYAVASATQASVVSESIVVAPTGATSKSPGEAVQAAKLAETYTILIPEDGGVIRAVARAVDRPASEVADDIATVGSPNTFLIRLRYTDDDEESSLAGARALTDAVIGSEPAARGVEPGTLRVVRLPRVDEIRSGGTGPAIPVGVFLGLCLGLVLVIALERADPRIDGEEDAIRALGCPATRVSHLSDASIGALLDRWQRLAVEQGDTRHPARIGFLAGTARGEELVAPAARMLATLAARIGRVVTVREPGDGGDGRNGAEIELLLGGQPGSEAAGESIVVGSAFTVLVVGRGNKEDELQAAANVVRQFGGQPGWALVVDRPDALQWAEPVPDAVPSRPVARV